MFGDNLFLDSIADRINLGLILEELYMLNLYSFYMYLICSVHICWVVRYLTPTLWVVGYLRLWIRVWDYLRLLIWLIGNLCLTFLY